MDLQGEKSHLQLKEYGSPNLRNSSFHHSQRNSIDRENLSKFKGSTCQSQNNGEKVPIVPLPYIDMNLNAC